MKAIRLATLATTTMLFGFFAALMGCKNDLTGPISFNVSSFVYLQVQNSGLATFSTNPSPDSAPILVGATSLVRTHSSSSPNAPSYSFDIQRQAVSIARVSYSVLRFPTPNGTVQNVTIIVTEGFSGVFTATTPDNSWINVLAVQTL